MSVRVWLCCAAAATACSSSVASIVTTTMVGRVATVSPPLQGLGVLAGDHLRLAFTFDDGAGVPSVASVNGGLLYQLQTYSFTATMDGWAGTLPALIASRTSDVTSDATKQSWSRPAAQLHHNEWEARAFGLSIITDYGSNPGGEHYGWYQYGQAATIAFLIDGVTTNNAAFNVPEPGSLALVLLATLATTGAPWRRRFSRPHGQCFGQDRIGLKLSSIS